MVRFDKVIYSSFLVKSILSVRFSKSLCKSDFFLFLEFINTAFFVYFLLDTKNMICLISFRNFLEALLVFLCIRAISNI